MLRRPRVLNEGILILADSTQIENSTIIMMASQASSTGRWYTTAHRATLPREQCHARLLRNIQGRDSLHRDKQRKHSGKQHVPLLCLVQHITPSSLTRIFTGNFLLQKGKNPPRSWHPRSQCPHFRERTLFELRLCPVLFVGTESDGSQSLTTTPRRAARYSLSGASNFSNTMISGNNMSSSGWGFVLSYSNWTDTVFANTR